MKIDRQTGHGAGHAGRRKRKSAIAVALPSDGRPALHHAYFNQGDTWHWYDWMREGWTPGAVDASGQRNPFSTRPTT